MELAVRTLTLTTSFHSKSDSLAGFPEFVAQGCPTGDRYIYN